MFYQLSCKTVFKLTDENLSSGVVNPNVLKYGGTVVGHHYLRFASAARVAFHQDLVHALWSQRALDQVANRDCCHEA